MRLPLIMSMCLLTPSAGALAQSADDPHLWLEDVTGEAQSAWVSARNAETADEFAETDRFRSLNERMLEILNSTDRIPYVQKIGGHYYNFWRDAEHQRGIWRRTTLAEYRSEEPAWEVVIDLDALAEAEGENWVWHGANVLEPDDQLCIVSLSRGGSDASVRREFNLATSLFVDDGFVLPEAKSSISWRGEDSVFVATDFGPESLTASGYPRIVKQWARGTTLDEAVTVFEGGPEDMIIFAYRDNTPGFERDFIVRRPTFWTSETYVRINDKLLRIDVPDDANTFVHREWLFIELRTDWQVGSTTFSAGALLAGRFDDYLQGLREIEVLFEPTERSSLASFSPTRNFVLLNVLDNVRNRLYVLRPPAERDEGWTRAPLPGVPHQITASANAVDPQNSDDYFLTMTGYLEPAALHMGSIGDGAAERLKSNPHFFDVDGLSVTRHEAISRDGTRIPYFQVAKENLSHDAENRTLMLGYGGFEVPLVPGYNAAVGAGWLEAGGVYVVANIRGGGEFGPRWHQAALKSNRHRAFEDFISVADDLIRRRVTAPRYLGIIGGSNGGLLVGNMLTMRPDLFGAVVGLVPLLDMKRYHTLLAGASWMDEYGDPELPEEWAFISTFSPYHNIRPDQQYPRTLFTSSTRDDRVHPAHARKMVARMNEQGHDVVYYENVEGGHGGAADAAQRAYLSSLIYTFLTTTLGL